MTRGKRTVAYDTHLGIEAFRFSGFDKPFPNHVHDHYVFGLVKQGKRRLACGGIEYEAHPGDLLLFNPAEAHGCTQLSEEPLEYWGLNIPKEMMVQAAHGFTQAGVLPMFSPSVIADEEAADRFCALHQAIMNDASTADHAEQFLQLIEHLSTWYGDGQSEDDTSMTGGTRRDVVEKACTYIQNHCCEQVSLDTLCAYANVGKSTLMRAFVKEKGITPYLYVESMRIEHARTLLERGVTLADAAAQTGFADQSHFSHYFKRITGLTPGAYRALFVGDGVSHD